MQLAFLNLRRDARFVDRSLPCSSPPREDVILDKECKVVQSRRNRAELDGLHILSRPSATNDPPSLPRCELV
jgi:hypothetical protein